MSRLISYYGQIEPNLRRTASKGLISLLNQQQLEDLAFKYFGIKDEYGNIVGYQCPYSGKVYTDYKDIVLEHIVPVASNGGTVLFNCIPTSKKVNGSNEKGAKHLIIWWQSSSYWDKDAPLRLEKIVNYMLDGYEQVFNEYTVEEVESSYLEIETDESILEEKENINLDKRNETKILKQAKSNGIHSYLGFILNCIDTLEKCNIDTTQIKDKLKTLENKHIFEDIERYQLFQNVIQKIIISRTGNDNRSYLTYTLNFNTRKLMDSINLDNEEEIYNEINTRLKNIEELLKINNLSIIEYFKCLGDITDIDIIYKNINNISEQEINAFIENVKIGIDTKINIFINMLNKGNNTILKSRNKETLEGYSNIKLSSFWIHHKEKVKQKLFEELKDNPEYDIARKLISINEMSISVEKQIPIFIDMLNEGNIAILKRGNEETLAGYPSINLSYFWNEHDDKIKQKLFEELKGNPKYDIARQAVLKYFKVSNYEELKIKKEENKSKNAIDIDVKIIIFINMLNEGNIAILKRDNEETLAGYPSINLSGFWHNHQNKIKQKLFEELKDNPKYDIARQIILTYFKVSNDEELKTKQAIDTDAKITIFINMLNKGNSTILKNGNKETLEGYSNIKLSHFWIHHKEKVKQKLFEEFKDNPEYDIARNLININEMSINVESQIPIFINMLNKGNNKILKNENEETLEGYPNIKLSNFWNNHKNKIKQKLFEELKDNPKYDIARNLININEMTINVENQIPIFINMLNKGNNRILKNENEETLEGYPNIKLSRFWGHHKDKIKQKLFNELKDDTMYDIARKTVLEYFKVSSYEELEAKKRKSKKLKEDKFIKQQLEKAINAIDEMEAIEQRKRA